jgi:NADH:ubiquinone oxidoreductase subunit 5 (subunit L)/multisubunit Na+/H+ antiporter MnhA subunit
LFDLAPDVQNIIAIVGRYFSCSCCTLVQTDIKKVLAYRFSLGLMFLALGGAYRVAVFTLLHTFFKASLLGSGSVIHALRRTRHAKWVD